MAMTPSVLAWVLIALALVAANLPFLSERLFLFKRWPGKHLGLRLLELLVGYLVVGAIGLALEQSVGQNAPQGWEFYAVTGTLFLTFAFPGFVYRYLYQRR